MDCVFSQFVIKTWWDLKGVGKVVAFKQPHNCEVEACNGEQYWNANTVHHCHESYIQDVAVLVMDDELGAHVNIKVLVDLGFFCDVRCFFSVFFPFLITFSLIPSDQIGNHLGKYGDEGIK